MTVQLQSLARRLLPRRLRRAILYATSWPPVGTLDLGSLRRITPISRAWGSDRGTVIDRYYVERFLGRHAADVRGQVLEVGSDSYTRKFGGAHVVRSEVLHVSDHGPGITLVADLSDGRNIPSNTYDCVILTQTLQMIYDVPAALRTVHRILRPGGVLLLTTAGITNISRGDMDRWGHYWSFTSLSLRRLLDASFGTGIVTVSAVGNVLATVGFLHGLAAEELRPEELEFSDPDFELLLVARAVKAAAAD